MFKRKIPQTGTQKMRQLLWPTMGWLRVFKFYRARVIRLASPAHTIAANMAGGAAMSFTPFFGVHIFGAMGFAWAIGAGMNLVAAVVGSFFGNPWTFPLLFYTSNRVGKWVLDIVGYTDKIMHIEAGFVEQHADKFHEFLFNNFWEVFFPTAVGGVVMAIISWPIFYYTFFYMVRAAQEARRMRIRRKQMRDFRESAALSEPKEDDQP